ncbi:kinase-like protein [Coprinellus micaceus]|uniref:Kinase-like protein n=1 Tax=Coprinellus micaceus TaxID=71717 RepID=A0A4Y7SQ08_COPMI|nr:kinase-like protein [Coprinellus micaceus]
MSFPIPGLPRETQHLPDWTPRLVQIDQFAFALGEHSDVFRARKTQDVRGKRVYAVKTLRAGSSSNPNFHAQLQRKLVRWGDVLGQLNHENVCTIRGLVYGTSRFPGIVMDFYEGGSIVNRMKSHSYTNDQKSLWVKQIASGMRYLHRRKPTIVHGDLRGSNIFLNSSGNIAIADIGMVYITDTPEFTMMQSAATARWTAPELMDPKVPRQSTSSEGPDCTIQSDVFAFAMTIVQIFSEALPFRHVANDTTCIFLILRGERPALPEFVQGHHALAGLVRDCWVRDPSKRPSMTDVCWRLGMSASS